MTKMHTLDQKRASFAWEVVKSVTSETKEYKNLSKGAPALVMNNGLMQAMAFYNSRKKGPGKVLAEHLQRWLQQTGIAKAQSATFDDVMLALQTCKPSEYMHATDETLEILRWIRQFSDAVIRED